jgi:hypothetical protein
MKETASFQDCSTPNGNAVILLPLECSVGSFGSEGAQTPRYLTSEDGIRTPSQRLRACPGPFPTQCWVSPASASALYPWRAACWCVGPGRGHTLSPPGPPAVAGPAVPRPSPRGNQQEQGRGRFVSGGGHPRPHPPSINIQSTYSQHTVNIQSTHSQHTVNIICFSSLLLAFL